MVTGSFSRISSVTGFWMRTESPRSPCSTPESPVPVAHRQRLVEVELLPQVLDGFRVAVLAGEGDRRVAGKELLQPEDQDRDEEQRRDDLRQAPQQVLQHLNSFFKPCTRTMPSGTVRRPVSLALCAHSQLRWNR